MMAWDKGSTFPARNQGRMLSSFRFRATKECSAVSTFSLPCPGLQPTRYQEPQSWTLTGARAETDPQSPQPGRGRGVPRKRRSRGRGAKTRTWRRSGYGAVRSPLSSCGACCSAGESAPAVCGAGGERQGQIAAQDSGTRRAPGGGLALNDRDP